jgi:DNA ligase (NAD+)
VAERKLDCYLYYVLGEQLGFTSHFQSIEAAARWGFKVSPHTRVAASIEQVEAFISEWESKRFELDVETDGIVIKVDEIRLQNNLGYTAKTPRWALAYKYKAQEAITRLLSVSYQVGRTGAITPVANLEPVQLAGTVVKRASLHNADIISELDLHEMDWVRVEKGGEIIPKITGVLSEKRDFHSSPISFITHCPECGELLMRNPGEANHFCPNEKGCPPQLKARVEHFTARKAMNIDSLGPETIAQLFEAGLVKNIADLYDLRLEQLLPLDRMAEKSAMNILDGIGQSTKVPFERVLFAIGIRHVGETLAKKLARAFGSMNRLMNASREELLQVNDVGEKIADSILAFFAEPDNMLMLERLKSAGLSMESEMIQTPASNILEGKTFVVSGVFHHFSRDGIKEAVEAHGGKVSGSISGKTHFVLAGDEMGPAKLEKAQKLGIKIISETDFLEMIGQTVS